MRLAVLSATTGKPNYVCTEAKKHISKMLSNGCNCNLLNCLPLLVGMMDTPRNKAHWHIAVCDSPVGHRSTPCATVSQQQTAWQHGQTDNNSRFRFCCQASDSCGGTRHRYGEGKHLQFQTQFTIYEFLISLCDQVVNIYGPAQGNSLVQQHA
jgi:hypothetical protein